MDRPAHPGRDLLLARPAHEALGNLEKAASDLRKAADLNPTSTDAIAQLHRLGVNYP
jgi:hypothetical protein